MGKDRRTEKERGGDLRCLGLEREALIFESEKHNSVKMKAVLCVMEQRYAVMDRTARGRRN